jgi:hypothetical protein
MQWLLAIIGEKACTRPCRPHRRAVRPPRSAHDPEQRRGSTARGKAEVHEGGAPPAHRREDEGQGREVQAQVYVEGWRRRCVNESSVQEDALTKAQFPMRSTPDLSDELGYAAFVGDVDLVRSFLAEGADPDGVTEEGWTPLALAANRGHLLVVETLLDAGANVNFQEEEEGESILMFSLQQDDEQSALRIAKRLIAAGASIHAIDRLGWTALAHAVACGQVVLAEALLAAGADPDVGVGTSARALCKDPRIRTLLDAHGQS